MTEKRFEYTAYDDGTESIYDREKDEYYFDMQLSDIEELLNDLSDENEQLKKVIAENEKLIQSTYDELTKLRCIKKNLGGIKVQWDWIMEAIQYD